MTDLVRQLDAWAPDPERTAAILSMALSVTVCYVLGVAVRMTQDARRVRRRLRQRQSLTIESGRPLSCHVCHQPHHRLQLVELADDYTFACDGCHAVLAGPEVVK